MNDVSRLCPLAAISTAPEDKCVTVSEIEVKSSCDIQECILGHSMNADNDNLQITPENESPNLPGNTDLEELPFVREIGEVNSETTGETEESQTDKVTDNVKLEPLEEEFIESPVPVSCDWSCTPTLLCSALEEYKPTDLCENFTKGCHWSPDGTCFLVPSEDFRIRIYDLPKELYNGNVSKDLSLSDLKPAVTVKEGGLVYDTCWFPYMSSWDPVTCCFLSTSRESPVHLWDAFTGNIRATYRAYNLVDEVEAAISTRFINYGKEVWCGFRGALRMFDTDRPGRQTHTIFLKKDFPNVTGLVSCIRENPCMPGLVAFGTYSKCIGLYKDSPICAFKPSNGVTQIEFSPCGMKLYSAVRRSNEVLCWDLRNPGVILWSLRGRCSDTNQRIQLAISSNGSEIVSGGTDGVVKVWKLVETSDTYEEDLNPRFDIKLSEDCVNGIDLHRTLPILLTTTGQRVCDLEDKPRDNSVRLWWFSSLS
ncbi:telomerase Cajal body protein 1 [Orussus abietinus]|uniref:telomerase Cajal body protein 1 n=1 Tax=Orussus abietinus TaxID=222816 RepID=UPI000626CCFF|nr:telomerase Cajal body protein 1 [Orussus abietinus]